MGVLYVIGAIFAFFLAALIVRWIFGIQKIIDLLTSIDKRLQFMAGSQGVSVRTAPDQGESEAPVLESSPFFMAITQISVGDVLVTPDGRRLKVNDFRRSGLSVTDGQGRTELLMPDNPKIPSTKWIFAARKA
jgi:hypothetical protein